MLCDYENRAVMSTTHEIALIAAEQIPSAGEVLARAFIDDPLCVYTQPDPTARISEFGWLFTECVRQGATQSGVYPDIPAGTPSGVAIWSPPQLGQAEPDTREAPNRDEMERRFGSEAYRRFSTYRHFEHVHQKRMAGPHWYLALVGVSSSARGQGIGQALLTPVLRSADEQGLPCYLETFVSRNVGFYERRGFEVVDAGLEEVSRIPFWAMKREPGC
jgi:ribosomal protein S18 acetylase RimI-like enzyme